MARAGVPECQKTWWGQVYMMNITHPPDLNRVNLRDGGGTSPHVPISSGGPAQVKQEVGKVNCSHKFQWTICQQQFLSVEIVRTKEKGESGHVISHGFTKAPGICSVLRSATDLKEYLSNRKLKWKSVRNWEP